MDIRDGESDGLARARALLPSEQPPLSKRKRVERIDRFQVALDEPLETAIDSPHDVA